MIAPDLHISALSFEVRAIGSALEWLDGRSSGTLLLIDYESEATPGAEAQELRRVVEEEILAHTSRDIVIRKIHVTPHSMRDMIDVLTQFCVGAGTVTVDITCMTRPHVVAAARFLAAVGVPDWAVTYSSPVNYGSTSSSSSTGGWRDTLILGLGDDTSMDNQGVSLGLMILGAEAGRIAVAFDDFETDAGIVVVTENPDRPDFHRAALMRTQNILQYLESFSLSGSRGQTVSASLGSNGWTREIVSLPDVVGDCHAIVDRLVTAAMSVETSESKAAPIVVYPIGPKFTIFCVIYWLTSSYADRAWCVYPIAQTHRLDYSLGLGSVHRWSSSQFQESLL
ncbi:hypothetical protein ACQEVI_20040 [Promicromonospora sp. CA-289599]|uniref:hypothetical protein n=1 Tax=Promicromonospora sp. CA-289599 TaxID=3240014 RepID=UPI003D913C7E